MTSLLSPQRSFHSTIAYGRQLVDSGIEGASTAVHAVLSDEPVNAALARAVRASWKPAAVGACIALALSALGRKKPGTALVSGLAGGAVGFSAGILWASHGWTAAAARGAAANGRATRDAHWLERHPIDYA